VIFFDSISCNEVYSSSANIQRSRFYTALQRSHHECNSLTTVNTKLHAQKRKLLNLSFTEKSLRAASSFMISHINRWIDLIAKECDHPTGWTAPKDFAELANVLVFDIITPPDIKAYYQFVHDNITKRSSLQEELREKPESQQRLDMFHCLRESKNPDTGAPAYSQEELWAEANMLIISGADTTAVSLCGIYSILCAIRFG